MGKVQWECDLVERPFCEQLQGMGWTWLEGDVDVPELTERVSFREVMLKGRLAAALRRLNLREGRPWLDDGRIARAIRDLEHAAGHRLTEVNHSATELLLPGTVRTGCPTGSTTGLRESGSSTSGNRLSSIPIGRCICGPTSSWMTT